MTKTIIITSVITSVLVVVLLFGLSLVFHTPQSLGAQVQNDVFYFVNGIKTGTSGTTQFDSSGYFVGQIKSSGSATFTGSTRIANPTITGSKVILTSGATSSISGTQVCAGGYIEFAPTSPAAPVQLPTAAALTCLTTNGDNIPFLVFKNTGVNIASTSAFATGASTTLVYLDASSTLGASATSTLIGGEYARLYFMETSSSDPTTDVTIFESKFK